MFGERRVFSIGVAGFGIVSLLCSIAPSIEVLIACRALQGGFGALLTPSALAVIVAAFSREERGAAIGSWTAWAGIATVVGPLAGGFLVEAVPWRLIFAVNIPFVVITLVLVAVAVPARAPGLAHARVDSLGAALTFVGLAGPVLALIRQPVAGWSSPQVWGPGLSGPALLAVFLVHERRTPAPMLPLGLFKRRNFAVGNVQTFAMYGGLGVTFFLLVLFLQEVAGYRALQAGFALMPSTIVMFVLSKRMGRLADRFGPRLFMGLGPLTAAVGLALMLRLHAHVNYFADLLPALLIFSVGLSCTVAPLTAAVLSDADESNAGIASGVNNAIARIAGLLAIAAVGVVISAQFSSTPDRNLGAVRLSPAARTAVAHARGQTLARVEPATVGRPVALAVQSASVHAFHVGIGISATLVALGGLLGLAGIRNPRRTVRCEDCAGGQLAGQPLDAVREQIPTVTLPQPAATAGAADSLSRDRRACPRVSYAGGTRLSFRRPLASAAWQHRDARGASRLCSFTAIVMVTVCKAASPQLRTVRRGSSTTSSRSAQAGPLEARWCLAPQIASRSAPRRSSRLRAGSSRAARRTPPARLRALSGESPGRRATGNYAGASGAFTLLGGSATGNNVGGHNALRDAGGQP